MIFFAYMPDEETVNEEEDAESGLDDSMIDEISSEDDGDAEVEGFGHIDDGEAMGEKNEEEEEEKKEADDDDDSIDSLEDDAEDVDYDTFDDVDEL